VLTGPARRFRRLPREVRQSLLSARLWSMAFQLTSKLSLLIATLLTASLLGVRDFGVLASLQGTAYLVGFVMDFGSSTFVEREIAAGRGSASLLRAAIRPRLAVVAPLAVLVVAGTFAWTHDDLGETALSCVFVTAALAINTSALTNGVLQGQLRFRGSALSQSMGRVLFMLGVAVLWLLAVRSLLVVGLVFALGELTIAATQARLLSGNLHFEHTDRSSTKRSAREALPYWLNTVFNLIYNRADVAVVALLAGANQAGLYAPASSIQNALSIVPSLAVTGLPNVGARVFSQGGHALLLSMFRRALVGGTLLGLVCAVAVTIGGIPFIHLLAGSAFRDSVLPTIILSWSLPFYAAETAILSYLIAVGRPAATTWGYGAALVTALLGLGLLAPAYGSVGASVGSLLREPVALVVLSFVAFGGRKRTAKGKSPGHS
jgi:O-antigen/teichoic acid export membrane protein